MKPEFAEIDNVRYKINTDYKVALECDIIAKNENISDTERTLAIIYKLFEKKGLNAKEHYQQLINIAIKFLKCGKEDVESDNKEEPNMDFKQDMSFIEASFMSDYHIDLSEIKMHWWKFYDLVVGLTEDCVLNRIRYVRDFDLKDIKDPNELKKWQEQKKALALKCTKKVKVDAKQQESINKFYELTGIKKAR